jgi:hypothetical protein
MSAIRDSILNFLFYLADYVGEYAKLGEAVMANVSIKLLN